MIDETFGSGGSGFFGKNEKMKHKKIVHPSVNIVIRCTIVSAAATENGTRKALGSRT